jgi:hypothetical protein
MISNNKILIIGILNLIWGLLFFFPFGLFNIILGIILIFVYFIKK